MQLLELRNHFHDPALDRLSAYFLRLYIHFGPDALQYGLLDPESNQFLALCDYALKRPAAQLSHKALMHELTGTPGINHKKFPSVVIGADSPYFTLVPQPFFDPGKLRQYLAVNFNPPENLETAADVLPELQACLVYGYDKGLPDAAREHYPEAAVFHSQTALLNYHHYQFRSNPERQGIFLHIAPTRMTLAVFNEGKLQYLNSFACQSREDILYYTLNALEQLRIRPGNATLVLSGDMDKHSATVTLLERYIREIRFAGRIGPAGYSAVMSRAPAHAYAELFGLYLCGS